MNLHCELVVNTKCLIYLVFDIRRCTFELVVCYTVGGVSHSVSRTYFFAIKRAMARAVEGGCKNLGVFLFFFYKKKLKKPKKSKL